MHRTPLWKVLDEVHKNPMTFLFLNVDIENIYIQKRKGTGCIMRQTTRRAKSSNLPIFQSSNLPIFQSSNLPIFQSSGGQFVSWKIVHKLPEDFAWKSSGSFPQSSEVQENKSKVIEVLYHETNYSHSKGLFSTLPKDLSESQMRVYAGRVFGREKCKLGCEV